MSDLPPLPEAANDNRQHGRAGFHERPGPVYTADQMQAYARAAVAAERERCAKLVDVPQDYEAWEVIGGKEGIDMLRELAAAIRNAA